MEKLCSPVLSTCKLQLEINTTDTDTDTDTDDTDRGANIGQPEAIFFSFLGLWK